MTCLDSHFAQRAKTSMGDVFVYATNKLHTPNGSGTIVTSDHVHFEKIKKDGIAKVLFFR
jgi:hypothetical protein